MNVFRRTFGNREIEYYEVNEMICLSAQRPKFQTRRQTSSGKISNTFLVLTLCFFAIDIPKHTCFDGVLYLAILRSDM